MLSCGHPKFKFELKLKADATEISKFVQWSLESLNWFTHHSVTANHSDELFNQVPKSVASKIWMEFV